MYSNIFQLIIYFTNKTTLCNVYKIYNKKAKWAVYENRSALITATDIF